MKITRRNFLASILAAPVAVAVCDEVKDSQHEKMRTFAKKLNDLGGYAVPPEVREDLMWEMNRDKLWDYNAPRVRSVFLKNGERYL